MDIRSATDRALTAAETVESDRVRLRSALEALFHNVGLTGLDVILNYERQRLAERFAGRRDTGDFVR